MKVYIDGQFYAKEDAKISVFDHGLLYGDGIFEGIRFYSGKVFRLDEHLKRLDLSARAIGLKLPIPLAEIREATLETIRQNKLQDGYVRLVITRGPGDLGLSPLLCPKATVIIIASTIKLYPPEMYANGLAVATCATRRISHGALSPMVKSLNYLNNIMAKMEALNSGAGEGLMLNEQGYVAECTGDNVFVIKDGKMSPMTDKEMKMGDHKMMKDGTMVMKDGKKMTMKNGQMCDMMGNMSSHDDMKMKE